MTKVSTRPPEPPPARGGIAVLIVLALLMLGGFVWYQVQNARNASNEPYSTDGFAPPVPIDSVKGYRILPAAGWRVLPLTGPMYTDFIAQAPIRRHQPGYFNITVQPANGITTADLPSQLPGAEQFPGFHRLRLSRIFIGGTVGVEQEATYKPNSVPSHIRQAIVLHNGRAYTMTAICAEEEYQRWKPDIQKMISSVQWLPPAAGSGKA